MSDHDTLLADLNDLPPELAVDRAAEVLAAAGQASAALAERDGYHTATLRWAAATLTEAYNTLLAHTDEHPPSPPPGPTTLAEDPDRLGDLLQAAAEALERAARAASEPSRIYALTHAADLAAQGWRACGNAKAAP